MIDRYRSKSATGGHLEHHLRELFLDDSVVTFRTSPPVPGHNRGP